MNRYFYLLASALFFFACSGDNSTSSSEISGTTEYQHVSIDKENHRIVVKQDAHTEEFCTLYQNVFKWSKIPSEADQGSDVSTYEIHGDTLVVFFNGNTDDPHYYLGGSTDKIYGEWENIGCYKYQDKVSCPSKDERNFEEQYEELVLTISENIFQEELVYKPAYFKYNDYMNSEYLLNLYGVLGNEFTELTVGSSTSLFSPERESDIKAVEKDRDIEVLEQTKTSKKFKLDGKTYDVKITDIDRDSLDYKVAISVKSGDKECSYEERQVNVTKENCKDQTTEGLQNYDAERHFQDTLTIRGTIVNTTGLDNFEKCIKEIAVAKEK
ncbi:MAG: hypothetical protein II835_05690 [Fibrobacter sp.]|nr:hypothetical protein [Fibrobacter sp.]